MGCTQLCGTNFETGRGFADLDGLFTIRPNYHAGPLGAGAALVSLQSANLDLQDATAGHFLVRLESDGDGVPDAVDNCTDTVNPAQVDSDTDGYGNACDSDFINDGIVGGPDFSLFHLVFGLGAGDSGFDPAADCDGDGQIGGPDFACFVNAYRGTPVPSGHACAGSSPCPAP